MSWLMWLVVFFLVIAAVVDKVRRSGIVVMRPNLHRSGNGGSAAKAGSEAERMLCCEHCGLYVPESEAVHHGGAVFCCREHVSRHAPR